jgi:peptide/nickel transport system permease protein
MVMFLVRRLAASVVVMFAASVLVFLGVNALPGDPAAAIAGENATPEVLKIIRDQFGLDDPLPVQYFHYVVQALHGNLGISTISKVPVTDIVKARLPVTFELTLLASMVGLLLGVGAGVISAVRRGKPSDYVANIFGLLGLSIPHFWLGLIGILVFSISLGLLPSSGYVPFTDDPAGNLLHILMPAVVLGAGLSAVLMRQTRSALLGQLSEDYVRTARGKGLSYPGQVRHAMRNSLTTVVTVFGLQVGLLMSGAIITEQIFVIPGFGKLMIDAVANRDYPVIQGAVLVTVTAYVVVNFLVDVSYAYLNPRVRLTGVSE